MKKICIIGHQGITKYLINNLIKSKFKVTHVICTDTPKENNVTDHHNFLKDKNNYKFIKFYKCKKYSLKSKKDQNSILSFDVDIFVVFGWSRLIPNWLIDSNKIVLGMHGGMFKPPRCRGRAVFNWALIGGYKKFYLYVMILDAAVDSGEIISIDTIKISDYDDIETLYLKYAVNGAKQIKKVISNIDHNIKPIKISNKRPTYLPKRNPEDGHISLLDKDYEIVNFVRAIKDPFPRAFLFYKNLKIKIDELIPFEVCEVSNIKIGTIINVFNNKMFSIKSKFGVLLIKRWKSSTNWYPTEGTVLSYSKSNHFKKIKKII